MDVEKMSYEELFELVIEWTKKHEKRTCFLIAKDKDEAIKALIHGKSSEIVCSIAYQFLEDEVTRELITSAITIAMEVEKEHKNN